MGVSCSVKLSGASTLIFDSAEGENMQNLKLKLVTSQQYEEHDNVDEMIIEGIVAERNGSAYITFKQVDPHYNVTINNLVKIKNGIVSIKRSGALESTMVFDVEKPYATHYETPYGKLNIYVTTHEIESEISEKDVNLKIKYEMMMQGKKISDNIYCIERVK